MKKGDVPNSFHGEVLLTNCSVLQQTDRIYSEGFGVYQPPSVLLVTAAFHCLSYEATVPSLGFSRSIDLDRVGTATEGPGPPPRELVSISLLHSCYMLRAAGSSFVAAQCQVCENSGYSGTRSACMG